MSPLAHVERSAEVDPQGLLILHHGRGTEESDLLGLADLLDPERRLLVACPRAPLSLPGSPGFHWYRVPRVGYPDPESFHDARRALADFHDTLWAESGIEPARTVLGGFSMGTVMSYAMAFGAGRPPPAGVLAFSGFIPIVNDWEPSFADRASIRAFIAHGRRDPIMGIEFAHRARALLEAGGIEVDYRESDAAHQIDPAHIPAAAEWLAATLLQGTGASE